MQARQRTARREFQVVRTRKSAPQGRHLTLAYVRSRATAGGDDEISSLTLYGQG